MNGLRTFWMGNRHFALTLVVLALAVRALLPSGHMVGNDTRGISVYVCDDAGGEAKTVTIKLGKTSGDHDKDKSDVCAFAGLGAVADFALMPAVAAPATLPEPVKSSFPDRLPGRGLAAPPPPSTGPPTLI